MSDDQEGTWFGGRRWTGIGAIAVVAVILLSAALLFLSRRGHHQDGSGTGPVSSRPSATTQPSASSARPAVVPSAGPPAGVVWQLVNGYAVPSSAADGPTRVVGTVASGFSHTATGALLALVNAQLRVTAGTPAACATEARTAFEHTAAAAAIADQCLHPTGEPERYQVAGYAYLSYSPNLATITYVIRDENSAKLVEVTGTVAWTGSDWLVSLPGAATGGNPIGPTAVVDSLSGFIAWAGA